MVGALSRFNNNYDQLSPLARRIAAELDLQPVCHNPFMNTVAQVVELAHCLEDSVTIVDQLLATGLEEEDSAFDINAGTGVGATEVPRGTLYHEYTVDENGTITGANLIIPTNMNHNNIERDLRALVPAVVDQSKEEITLALEMLVRSYDPCISCSTHLLTVDFV
jgi:coenzyme F420-reducing hydrogenase alpha subunit